MNRHIRKLNGMNHDKRRYMNVNRIYYKTTDDYFAHYQEDMEPDGRKYWQRYINVNIWKRCQKRHANKRIRNIFDNSRILFDVALPQNAQYKKVHELVIY